MTEKHRRKLVRDAAEEVCWGIVVAAHSGIDILTYIQEDMDNWADLVDWEEYR
jgi:hypothetical protein